MSPWRDPTPYLHRVPPADLRIDGGKGDRVLGSLSGHLTDEAAGEFDSVCGDRMTRRKNRKRMARERAAKTGESYVTALRVLRARSQETAMTSTTDEPEQMQGAFLVTAGLLTQEDLESALSEQRSTRRALGPILLDRGIVAEADLIAAIAVKIGTEFVDLDHYPVDASAARLGAATLPPGALAIGWDDDRLIVAIALPVHSAVTDRIGAMTEPRTRTVLTTRAALMAATQRHLTGAHPAEQPEATL